MSQPLGERDPVFMNRLLDVYGGLLTDRQRELFELYWAQDLSLAEIAEETELSRQGVNNALTRAEQSMREYERQLGLLARADAAEDTARRIEQTAGSLGNLAPQSQARRCREALLSIAAELRAL